MNSHSKSPPSMALMSSRSKKRKSRSSMLSALRSRSPRLLMGRTCTRSRISEAGPPRSRTRRQACRSIGMGSGRTQKTSAVSRSNSVPSTGLRPRRGLNGPSSTSTEQSARGIACCSKGFEAPRDGSKRRGRRIRMGHESSSTDTSRLSLRLFPR